MIPIYHDIVGRGMIMELAFSIDRRGLVDPAHETVYRQLGDWVKTCYGTPIAMTTAGASANEFRLRIPKGAVFDRIQIKEDIVFRQRIRNYTIAFDGGDEVLVQCGTSVGRKRIHLFDNTYLAARENAGAENNAHYCSTSIIHVWHLRPLSPPAVG